MGMLVRRAAPRGERGEQAMPGNWTEPPGEKIALEDLAAQAHWQSEYHRILREMHDAERGLDSPTRTCAAGSLTHQFNIETGVH